MTVACCEATDAVGGVDRDLGRVELACGEQLLRRQFLGARVLLLRVGQLHTRAIQLAARLGQVGAGLHEVGLHLIELRVEQRRVEPRDDLALLDDAVEVGAEPLDVARTPGCRPGPS